MYTSFAPMNAPPRPAMQMKRRRSSRLAMRDLEDERDHDVGEHEPAAE